MNKMMDAWVLHGRENIRLETRTLPPVNKEEVLVGIKQAGIYGSDLAYYRNGKVGNYRPSRPFVPGHECAGEIVEVGSAVKEIKGNDRVAVDPSISCGDCEYCYSGRSNLCKDMKFLGSAMYLPPVDGTFSEYIVMPAKNCMKLPDEIGYEVGALLEPMSVAYYALQRAGDLKGKSVLISGAGTIGQLLLLFANALGVEKVVVADPVQVKREFALKRGATGVLDPASEGFSNTASRLVPGGFQVVLEASGSIDALRQGLDLASPGGTIVQVGILPPEERIPLGHIFFNELNYIASFRFCNVFEKVMSMCASGDVNVKELISRTFPFDELDQAIRFAGDTEDIFKVQVRL